MPATLRERERERESTDSGEQLQPTYPHGGSGQHGQSAGQKAALAPRLPEPFLLQGTKQKVPLYCLFLIREVKCGSLAQALLGCHGLTLEERWWEREQEQQGLDTGSPGLGNAPPHL